MVRWLERGATQESSPLFSEADSRRIRGVLLMGGLPFDQLEDGLQQVRLKLLEAQADPDRPEIREPAAWMAVVASRIATDWHRGRARDAGLRERLATRWSLRPPTDHPQEHRDLALTMADGLERLTPLQRQALVLRYYADLPLSEIARQLDIPEGTAKSRIHGAVAALRTQLSDMEAI
ncbi:RNA polymerase sigma factor [Streptomyces apocyni]|uniref:RNA polymerase sigma factor n=1 Tax=Streptomyces apocyni TaxID=2654677 RepID=UPI0012EAAECA|nr:sigma-70 family RNA polymerase sigma factor [Streptomyces apocyni]